jgi:hypothetical protein
MYEHYKDGILKTVQLMRIENSFIHQELQIDNSLKGKNLSSTAESPLP